MSNAKLNKLCMEESDPMLKIIVRCKLLRRSRIPKDDFGFAPSMVFLVEIAAFPFHFNLGAVLGDGHVGGAIAAAGGLPLALFAGAADALGVAGAIGGLPLAPFVGAADALGSANALGAAGGLPHDLFAGPGDALGAAGGLPLDLFTGPGDALGAAGSLPLDLFVECSPSVCAFYKYSYKQL
ncbi:hypothetical protein MTR67_026094 [Solanum verrucosum]|uniref:Uncharacterized protein n=1 Tax=Solanum verrucosum TaxID=315347 RepID=A0AAF0TUH0_SOLVR|nr:hypothetical protein MTR67_026094 [Solanum verrucosum]